MKWESAAFEISAGLGSQLIPSDLPEVALSGRSNVGKSSLINRILGRKSLARTSSTPGKTATINFYKLDEVRLIDLPGYGYAKVSASEKDRWNKTIGHYFSDDRDLRLVMQLLDVRHAPSADDMTMMNYMVEQEVPFVVVLTKCDKLNKTQRVTRMEELKKELYAYDGVMMIPFSSLNGEGAAEIRQIIEEVTA